MGEPGWIHTSYDNSTSTTTLDWIEIADLENQLEVTALSIARITTPNLADINDDGKVDIKDVSFVARRFGIAPDHPLWDPVADLNGDSIIDIKDVSTVARHFGDQYP
jgi:hypothetical protein